MQINDLGRRFFLDVDAAGFVFIRERGTGPSPHGALPVFSVDTYEQAKTLRVRHCRRARDGSGLYRLNEPPTRVEDLDTVSDLFRASHARQAEKQDAASGAGG